MLNYLNKVTLLADLPLILLENAEQFTASRLAPGYLFTIISPEKSSYQVPRFCARPCGGTFFWGSFPITREFPRWSGKWGSGFHGSLEAALHFAEA